MTSLNPQVLARLRAVTKTPAKPASSPARRRPAVPLPDAYALDRQAGLSDTPKNEDCVRCGRTHPGNVYMPDGSVQLPVIEAAAANYWLSMEELKKVRGAAALRSRDRELVQQVLAEYGYAHNTPPSQAVQELLNEVWQSMATGIGPNWTPTPSGWVCPGCAPTPEAGESTTGLGGLSAELAGVERTGEEEDEVDLGDLTDALGLEIDQAEDQD